MVRIKERYLLVNIIYLQPPAKAGKDRTPNFLVHHQPTTENLTAAVLARAIKAEVANLFGDYGAGALEGKLAVKYLSPATSTIILRCPRQHYRLLWAALTFMDRVPVNGGRPCIFRVVRVSGTIRKAEEEAVRQARKLILQAKEEQDSGGLSFLTTNQGKDTAMSRMADLSDGADHYEDDEMDSDDG